MNPPAPQPQRTGWLFRGPWWRRALILLAGVAVLVGAFYAEEDWRGRREWNQYRQAMEARGVSLDFQTYVPKPVPDEENFAAAKIVHDLFMDPNSAILTNDLYSFACNNVQPTNSARNSGHRHFEDLVAWQMAARALQHGPLNSKQEFASDKTDLESRRQAAPVVLEGMKTDEAVFAALRLASTRPYSRFPLEYNREDPATIPIMHLAKIKQLCQRLNLQTCAELAAGQTNRALADVELMLYLADSIKLEPMLLSFLVRAACFQIAVQPVWEGLAEHRWSEEQLQEIETSYQRYRFLSDLDEALKVERAWGIGEVDLVRKKGLGVLDELSDINFINQPTPHKILLTRVGRIMPAGWYEMERRNYCLLFDAQMNGVIDLAENRVFPSRAASNYAALTLAWQLPNPETSSTTSLKSILHHRAIARDTPRFLSKTPARAAIPQTLAAQAAIACALERYRLANGQFPETLDALTPKFISPLPNDVITGQPYKYRRTADGQFVLYSVGWNEKDDGGIPGKRLFDDKDGDWVWDYPVN